MKMNLFFSFFQIFSILKKSAQYLHKELPVRIAHRIQGFRSLPFIVGCNPTLLAVVIQLCQIFQIHMPNTRFIYSQHELYIRAFQILSQHPPIRTYEDEAAYSRLLRNLLEDHTHVVTQLAAGFKECRKHIQVFNYSYLLF